MHLQRFYLSIVLGLASFGKQVSRLRSWKETRRTSAFCAVSTRFEIYGPLVDIHLDLFRSIAPQPPRTHHPRDTDGGHILPGLPRHALPTCPSRTRQHAAGQLGTLDSLMGAPEKQEGEAVEEEAANFVTNVSHLVQRAVGMHEKDKNDGDLLEGKVPKPVQKAVKAVKAKGSGEGHATETNDQTQEPMEQIL